MDRKKLIDYLPPIMQNFAEIKQITKVEQKETDTLDYEIGRILDNAFIQDCDEYGIEKYEYILGITASNGDKLDVRKMRALARWNNSLPYSYRILIRKLDILCGVGEYLIEDDSKHYALRLRTYFEDKWKVNELREVLEQMLPVNIVLDYLNTIIHNEKISISGIERILFQRICLKLHLKEKNKEVLAITLRTTCKISDNEQLEAIVIKKKNDWYLDGTFLLSGEKTLNAVVKKEVL